MTIDEQFRELHAANPGVYDEIVRLARLARRRGHRRYSVDLILAVIRFRRDMRLPSERDQSGFKLNNTYTSRYARLVMDQEPDLRDIFEVRILRSA